MTSTSVFRHQFSLDVFNARYRHEGAETWEQLANTLVWEVMGGLVPDEVVREAERAVAAMEFIPGGRYLYYAGRGIHFYNNCYLLKSEEDSREDWAALNFKSTSATMTGGGIGNVYSIYREKGRVLSRTGGLASGPLPAMEMVNEIGRRVMQGGSRRSAIWAGLHHWHPDVHDFLVLKDWDNKEVANGISVGDLKRANFNFPAPLDHTNVSVLYSDEWLALPDPASDPVFVKNIEMAMRNGEPGLSFDFGAKANETARNACTEVTSADDSDVCNLGSVNLSRIESLERLKTVVEVATAFLLCGTIRATLPYEKVYKVREKNRRLGLGLMGVHEWLLKRGYRYEMNDELRAWLSVYRDGSDEASRVWANALGVNRPVANRAIAPTGTIGILAGTTTGVEPIYAPAFKRRYLKGNVYHYQMVVEPFVEDMKQRYGVDPDSIESAADLAADPERRIKFQADVQDYVDMGISSTLNLPAWGSELNNPDKVSVLAKIVAKYAPRLRGLTFYPDGARGGQPLQKVSYAEAKAEVGVEHVEEMTDVCSVTGKGGTCGV